MPLAAVALRVVGMRSGDSDAFRQDLFGGVLSVVNEITTPSSKGRVIGALASLAIILTGCETSDSPSGLGRAGPWPATFGSVLILGATGKFKGHQPRRPGIGDWLA
jgi:hypothetical protein